MFELQVRSTMQHSQRTINRKAQREACARKICRRMFGSAFREVEAREAEAGHEGPQFTFDLTDRISAQDANKAAHELEELVRREGPGYAEVLIDKDFRTTATRWWHSDLVSKDNLLTVASDETADGLSSQQQPDPNCPNAPTRAPRAKRRP